MRRITINKIKKSKNKKPLVCLSVYSKFLTDIADKYCDILLVGDSLGMVLHGMNSTREVSFDDMIRHGKTVRKFAKRSLVVVDMPYKSYTNKMQAYQNAKKIMKLTNCDAVKLEGGKNVSKIIQFLVRNKVPVMGHVGLLPQSSSSFKLQGKKRVEKIKILNDAIAISKSGAFSIVIECVIEKLAKKITNTINIPTIGIGASKYCDGQILVADDIIGLTDFTPKFVKRYSNLKSTIQKSIKKYSNDVKNRKFPSIKNTYK